MGKDMLKTARYLLLFTLLIASVAAAQPATETITEKSTEEKSTEQTGGPDGFGYVYTDSNGGGPLPPTFLFIDVAASGTPRLLAADGSSRPLEGAASGTPLMLADEEEATVSLPFLFPFYEDLYDQLRIGNNGSILPGAVAGDVPFANPCPLQTAASGTPRISPFWDDLDDESGDVWVAAFSSCPHPAGLAEECYVVQWDRRDHFSGLDTETVTFEAILFSSGFILFQYLDVDLGDPGLSAGASASVGIQDGGPEPDHFLEYQCNQGELEDALAILWFRLIPVELQTFTIE